MSIYLLRDNYDYNCLLVITIISFLIQTQEPSECAKENTFCHQHQRSANHGHKYLQNNYYAYSFTSTWSDHQTIFDLYYLRIVETLGIPIGFVFVSHLFFLLLWSCPCSLLEFLSLQWWFESLSLYCFCYLWTNCYIQLMLIHAWMGQYIVSFVYHQLIWISHCLLNW